jgi:exopolysaccharide biosynthesis polyprenyl glycosylphosphotransferase
MRYSKLLQPFTFLCDLMLLNIALQCAHVLVFNYYSSEIQLSDFLLLVNLTWITIASVTKNYVINRPLVLNENISKFLSSMAYHLVLVLGITYFFKLYEISRMVTFFTYLLFFIFIIIERSIIFFTLDYIRKKGYNIKHILLIGNDEIARQVTRSFAKRPEYGYNFIGTISEEKLKSMPREVLFSKIMQSRPSEVFICYKLMDQNLLKSIIELGDQNSIKIKLISDLVLENTYAHVINYEDFPAIQLSSSLEIDLKIKFFKRCFDIMFSLLVMIPGLPIFILLAIITKLTSKGPVFYRQERVGRNHKPFGMYKFRSMYVNSEQAVPLLSKDKDPRITKWGVFLRKSRLDELPQFWNVLKGDMSIVGPRPERQYFIEQLIEESPNYKKLFKLKPGLTSIGQVNYGYAENIQEMRHRVRYDLIYLNNMNFNNDVKIIFQTIRVMVQLKGK